MTYMYVMKKKQMEEEQLTVNNETQHKSVRKRSKRKADSSCCAARAATVRNTVRNYCSVMSFDDGVGHVTCFISLNFESKSPLLPLVALGAPALPLSAYPLPESIPQRFDDER